MSVYKDCSGCGASLLECSCSATEDIESYGENFFEDLNEKKLQQHRDLKRCLGCAYFKCRCKDGHKKRLDMDGQDA